MLQPGDVLVVDLFGKKDGGTIVGDNLFYYIMKATKGGGLVVDGAIRDLEGISSMEMPAYFRAVASQLTHQRDDHGHQRAGAHRQRDRDARRSRGRRPRGRLLHSAALVQQIVDNADVVHSTTNGRGRSSTRASTSRARSTARRRIRRSRVRRLPEEAAGGTPRRKLRKGGK